MVHVYHIASEIIVQHKRIFILPQHDSCVSYRTWNYCSIQNHFYFEFCTHSSSSPLLGWCVLKIANFLCPFFFRCWFFFLFFSAFCFQSKFSERESVEQKKNRPLRGRSVRATSLFCPCPSPSPSPSPAPFLIARSSPRASVPTRRKNTNSARPEHSCPRAPGTPPPCPEMPASAQKQSLTTPKATTHKGWWAMFGWLF